jgi:hypothetical protein
LPPELSKRLRAIRQDYFGWYGFEGAYRRMNKRSVAQIFSEYQAVDMRPVAFGEVGDVRYRLTEVLPADESDRHDRQRADGNEA